MKQDLRVQKTKHAVHTALLTLLQIKPLEQIKVTELCKLAQINRGTFYAYYEQVGDIFTELFAEITKDLKDSYHEPYKDGKPIDIMQLDPQTIRIFHHVKKYEHFYRIVLSKNVSIRYYFMLYDQVKNILMNDRFSGEGETEERAFLFSYMANGIIGIIIQWLNNDFKDSVATINDRFVSILHRKK